MIDFINCRQSQQSLLLDARSYAGTVLNSDHRLVVSRVRLSRVFGMWGRKAQNFTKPKHYSVDLLTDTNESSKYKQHLTSCMNELSNEFEADISTNTTEICRKSHRRGSSFLNRNYTTQQITVPSFLSRDKPHVT